MPKKVTGQEYEYLCARFLRRHGFSNVQVTKGSGDQGVDITANKNRTRYAVQCKYYAKPVSNKAVQEVVAGMHYHDCEKAIVMTNSTFTKGAEALAEANEVELWPNVTRAGGRRIGFVVLLCLLILAMLILLRSPLL